MRLWRKWWRRRGGFWNNQSNKGQKRDEKTKLLIKNRVQTAGLVNGRWTVLPRDFKFEKGMTVKHLIDSLFLWDLKKKIPPFLTLQVVSYLTPSQQFCFRKMRAIMGLVKKYALEENCWAGDGTTKHWNYVMMSSVLPYVCFEFGWGGVWWCVVTFCCNSSYRTCVIFDGALISRSRRKRCTQILSTSTFLSITPTILFPGQKLVRRWYDTPHSTLMSQQTITR